MRKGKIFVLVRAFAALLAIALLALPFAGNPVLMAAVPVGVTLLYIGATTRTADARAGSWGLNLHSERRHDLYNDYGFGGVQLAAKSKKFHTYQNRLPEYMNRAVNLAKSVAAGLSSKIHSVRHHIIGRMRGSCRHLYHREAESLSLGYG